MVRKMIFVLGETLTISTAASNPFSSGSAMSTTPTSASGRAHSRRRPIAAGGDGHLHAGALTRRRTDLRPAAQRVGALAHAVQSQTRARGQVLGIESRPIVMHPAK